MRSTDFAFPACDLRDDIAAMVRKAETVFYPEEK